MKTITFNHNEFNFDLNIIKDKTTSYNLAYDKIGQMVLSSTIGGLVSLNFTYAENPENSIIQTIAESGCETVSLVMKFSGMENGKTVDKELNLIFIIDDIKLNGNDVGEQVYQIKSVLFDTHQLERNIQYYSSSDDPITIIKNIVSKSKCRAKFDYSDVSSTSGVKIEHISFANESLLNQIIRLLESASSKSAVYYFGYDLIERKYKVMKIGKDNFDKKKALTRTIPLSTDFTSDGVTSFTSFMGEEKFSSSLSYDLYNGFYMNLFDPKTRKWTREKISDREEVAKTVVPNDQLDLIFSEQQQQADETFSKIDVYGFDKTIPVGNRNQKVMFNGDRIKVKLTGDLRLMAGGMIIVSTNDKTMISKYGGPWIISSVSHWFEKEKFTSDLLLCRGFRMKEQDSK